MARLHVLFAVMFLALAGCNLAANPPLPTDTPLPPQVDLTCGELVARAIQTVGAACNATGRNQACYGNFLVDAELQQDAVDPFTTVGDLASLQSIRLISTSPLDEIAQTWGVSILKAQVNLPDALPGQNVTFLLYGGATLDNLSPRMEAVILSTGFGSVTCAEAPDAALLLQSPTGTQVSLNINGADLTLGSTLYLTARANQQMTIAVVSGSATVSALGTTRTLVPGSQVRLPLGSTDGLLVIGPPSEIEPFDLDAILLAPFELLPERVQIPVPLAPTPTETPTQPSLPVTATLPSVVIPLPPTAIPTVCVPRADWVYTYRVQAGDTLFSIAQRFNLTLTQLQTANCIPNPNIITVGQILRVPFPPPPTVPPPTATRTPGIGPTLQPTSTTIPFFPTDTPVEDEEVEPTATETEELSLSID